MDEYTSCISEVHHRVKNNLQVLVSLFNLKAHRTTNPQVLEVLSEMQNRVRAIAYLHEPLYSTADFSTIHFGEYLDAFVRELHASYGVGFRVEMQISVGDLALTAAEAVPLALILNELVSNAMKYAFPDSRTGKISIALRYASRRAENNPSQFCELEIVDDGVGLPQGTDFMTAESLGFYMVRVLTQQLQGTAEMYSGREGTSFRIAFPLANET